MGYLTILIFLLQTNFSTALEAYTSTTIEESYFVSGSGPIKLLDRNNLKKAVNSVLPREPVVVVDKELRKLGDELFLLVRKISFDEFWILESLCGSNWFEGSEHKTLTLLDKKSADIYRKKVLKKGEANCLLKPISGEKTLFSIKNKRAVTSVIDEYIGESVVIGYIPFNALRAFTYPGEFRRKYSSLIKRRGYRLPQARDFSFYLDFDRHSVSIFPQLGFLPRYKDSLQKVSYTRISYSLNNKEGQEPFPWEYQPVVEIRDNGRPQGYWAHLIRQSETGIASIYAQISKAGEIKILRQSPPKKETIEEFFYPIPQSFPILVENEGQFMKPTNYEPSHLFGGGAKEQKSFIVCDEKLKKNCLPTDNRQLFNKVVRAYERSARNFKSKIVVFHHYCADGGEPLDGIEGYMKCKQIIMLDRNGKVVPLKESCLDYHYC